MAREHCWKRVLPRNLNILYRMRLMGRSRILMGQDRQETLTGRERVAIQSRPVRTATLPDLGIKELQSHLVSPKTLSDLGMKVIQIQLERLGTILRGLGMKEVPIGHPIVGSQGVLHNHLAFQNGLRALQRGHCLRMGSRQGHRTAGPKMDIRTLRKVHRQAHQREHKMERKTIPRRMKRWLALEMARTIQELRLLEHKMHRRMVVGQQRWTEILSLHKRLIQGQLEMVHSSAHSIELALQTALGLRTALEQHYSIAVLRRREPQGLKRL